MDVAAFMRPRLATALGVTPDLVTDDLELATLGPVVARDHGDDLRRRGRAGHRLPRGVAGRGDDRRPADRRAARPERRPGVTKGAAVTRERDAEAAASSSSWTSGPAASTATCSTTTSPPASEWTFADLPVRAARVAGQLAAAGVAPAERVGVLADDRAVFCDAFYGLQHLGAIPVPLGLAGQPAPTRGARCCATGSSASGSWRWPPTTPSAATLGPRVPELRAVGVDGARGNPVPGRAARTRSRSSSRRRARPGHPKGIVISQAAVLANLRVDPRAVADRPRRDSGLSWLPAVPRHGTDRHGDQRALHRRDAAPMADRELPAQPGSLGRARSASCG